MASMPLVRIAQLTGGKLIQGNPETLILSFTFDSRSVSPGALFFALKGARDGHEFVYDAYEKGAIAACVSEKDKNLPPDFGLVLVDDTLKALQRLATRVLVESPVKVVAITGSIGKTSTKEFTARLLSTRFKILKSPRNFNNRIGLPISILSMNSSHEIAVLEMGMSQAGEIRELTEIAPPDVAVLTGIAPVHLEFFASLEDIAMAKEELLEGAKPGALAVLNGDDPLVRKLAGSYSKGQIIFFGTGADCPVRAENIRHLGLKGMRFNLVYGQEKAEVAVPFLNEALVNNLLAACAVAFSFSVKLDKLLPAFSELPTIEHRGELLKLKNGVKIYDDSYNSNPVALSGVLKSLSHISTRRKIAVLGDMLELGARELDFHRETGKKIPEYGWDVLVTVGPRAKLLAEGAIENGFNRDQIFSFNEADEARNWLKTFIQAGDFLLIKGSRAMALDRIIQFLKNQTEV
jgi:UDP-N-acetylmuramoyl-tripeptide--D-alanyl-D-alanine ligase